MCYKTGHFYLLLTIHVKQIDSSIRIMYRAPHFNPGRKSSLEVRS
jgi:hypothetical protein